MMVDERELGLSREDMAAFGFSMIHDGKRVPPDQWEEVFATYPGVVGLNEAAAIDDDVWQAILDEAADSRAQSRNDDSDWVAMKSQCGVDPR